MDKIRIFGVEIFNINFQEASHLIGEFLKVNKPHCIFTPNTEIVMAARKSQELKELINSGDLVIPDGIGLIYGSRIRKRPLKERVTGYDLSMDMIEKAVKNNYSLYFLGGRPTVAEKAADNLRKKFPEINIVGTHHGYFKGVHSDEIDHEEEKEIIEEINRLKPDIIFVGLGFPKQEKWINYHYKELNTRIIIGNGGVLDVLAGEAKRAPDIFIKLNLEWFYRLLQNPSRLKRQMAIPKFLWAI
ncbi:MAG: WecB/TagA/CpsF family glycosyltransferase, partial [Tissierellia bacterium]|nr:WecB/TagA/CpsF family glycosyltransferase [Tissierellia bacterium]